jgi:hypothetical protein
MIFKVQKVCHVFNYVKKIAIQNPKYQEQLLRVMRILDISPPSYFSICLSVLWGVRITFVKKKVQQKFKREACTEVKDGNEGKYLYVIHNKFYIQFSSYWRVRFWKKQNKTNKTTTKNPWALKSDINRFKFQFRHILSVLPLWSSLSSSVKWRVTNLNDYSKE